jgi:cadmium resistance protein CadD (predicted permease)
MSVSKPVALTLNTLNILAPTLLLLAVILVLAAKFSNEPPEVKNVLNTFAVILVPIAIAARILWGIAIRNIRRQAAATKSQTS